MTTLLAVNTTREAVSGTVTLADGLPPQTVELPALGYVFIEITTFCILDTSLAEPDPLFTGNERH